MTPASLVKTAFELSPSHWKGVQTAVRRLARKEKAPDAVVHAALRLAVKQHQRHTQSSWREHKSFRANLDTPADVQASYLQNPHAFGLSRFADVLSWAQQASSATLLKMTHYRSAALLVLLERNHGQAAARLNAFMDNSGTDEFNALKSVLLAPGTPWSRAAVEAFGRASDSVAHRLWYKDVSLLKRFEHEALVQGQPGISIAAAKKFMGSYPMSELLNLWPSVPQQRVALETAWERIAIMVGQDPKNTTLACNSQWSAWGLQGLNSWHDHKPTQEQCTQLAIAMETCMHECTNHIRSNLASVWRERSPWLEPWIRMVGNTPQAGDEAWAMYTSIDPDLLSFSSLAIGASTQTTEPVNNLSELLCP